MLCSAQCWQIADAGEFGLSPRPVHSKRVSPDCCRLSVKHMVKDYIAEVGSHPPGRVGCQVFVDELANVQARGPLLHGGRGQVSQSAAVSAGGSCCNPREFGPRSSRLCCLMAEACVMPNAHLLRAALGLQKL